MLKTKHKQTANQNYKTMQVEAMVATTTRFRNAGREFQFSIDDLNRMAETMPGIPVTLECEHCDVL